GAKLKNQGATNGLVSRRARPLPYSDQGLVGATRIRRRKRFGASEAAIMATAPPCEVPSRSHRLTAKASRNRNRRSPLARRQQLRLEGRSEKPVPSMSMA